MRALNCQMGSQVHGAVFFEHQHPVKKLDRREVRLVEGWLAQGLTTKTVQMLMTSLTSGEDIFLVVQHSTAREEEVPVSHGRYSRTLA